MKRTTEGKRRRQRQPRLVFVAAGRSGKSDTAERREELLFADLAPHGSSRSRTRRA